MPTKVQLTLIAFTTILTGNLLRKRMQEELAVVWIGLCITSMFYKRGYICLLREFKERQVTGTGWSKIMLEIILLLHV
ncbi:hypothetical protein L873DRAFT_1879143 [Choiromyces venosus 120613-1]|uniref:Uncharacterized protein n=1 Tax=Choiromyces venosus 120613-1 TaxID=1336337 RepID=A0A3N4JVP4_9PEZI|nr:hypothetical protein L873DRAFT_1879143 [Choiromyces venosus 120613-1]